MKRKDPGSSAASFGSPMGIIVKRERAVATP